MREGSPILMFFSNMSIGNQYVKLVSSLVAQKRTVTIFFLGSAQSKFFQELQAARIEAHFHLFQRRNLLSSFIHISKVFLNFSGTIFVSGWDASRFVVPIARLFGVKDIIYVRHHGSLHYMKSINILSRIKGRFLDISIQRLSSCVVSVSNAQSTLIQKEFLSADKIRMIPNSYNNVTHLNEYPNFSYKESINNGQNFRIAIIGRIELGKGVHHGVKAVSELALEFDGIELLIVGKKLDAWIEVEDILRSSKHLKWSWTETLEDMASFYKSINCVLHTPTNPLYESFSLVCVEALWTGRYLVATASGFLVDDSIARSSTYLVSEYDNHRSIIDPLRQLLTSSSPKSLQGESRDWLKSYYSLEMTTLRYLDLFSHNSRDY